MKLARSDEVSAALTLERNGSRFVTTFQTGDVRRGAFRASLEHGWNVVAG
jgi:hypothetical protein